MAGYRDGANSHVVKPVDFEASDRAVRDVGWCWAVLNEPPPEPR